MECPYCGSWIDATATNCPACGAVNVNMARFVYTTPRTIEELQQWYTERNLPSEEVTRFFIGKDVRTPRAFGIYKQGARYIVYKNKADGSRAIRYEGPDEGYAVNELYLKLKEEILNQKMQNLDRRANTTSDSLQSTASRKSGNSFLGIFAKPIFIGALILAGGVTLGILSIPFLNTFFITSGIMVALFFITKGIISSIYEKKHPGKKWKVPAWFIILFAVGTIVLASTTVYSCGNTGSGWSLDTYESTSSGFSSDIFDSILSGGSSSNSGSSYNRSSDWDSGYDWSFGDSWDSGGMDWSSDW